MRSYLQQVLHFLILLLRQFISGHLIVPLLHHTVPGRFGSYGDPIIRILDSRFKAQGTGCILNYPVIIPAVPSIDRSSLIMSINT